MGVSSEKGWREGNAGVTRGGVPFLPLDIPSQ